MLLLEVYNIIGMYLRVKRLYDIIIIVRRISNEHSS